MAKRPTPEKPRLTRRQASRARREQRLQRAIWIGTATITFLVVGLIIFAILNENVIKPNREIVSVNGDSVSIAEFQDRVRFNYYLQTGGQPIEQLGVDSSFFGQLTMSSIIDELLIEQQAAEMGIEITEEELEEEIELSFGYDAGEPEPTPTGIPTQEAAAELTATPTFVLTPTPSPTPTLAPGVTPTATPSEPAGPTPTPLPLPTAEPMTEEQFTEQVNEFVTTASAATGLSEARVEELLREQVRLVLLQQKLFEDLELEVDDTKTMIHAAHILVETEEEAQEVLARLDEGEVFEEIAAEVSQDASNAYRGGNLGWFGRNQMTEPFENAAFALEEGEISQPIETSFGWHIIKVYERAEDVPLTAAEESQQQQEAFTNLLDQWQEEADIEQLDNWATFTPEL